MGIYAITGGASGIGAAVKNLLLERKHSVISIDVREADITADLSTESGCQQAIDILKQKAPSGLDGFVPCAGVGPNISGDILVALNYVGVVRMTEGAMPLLQKKNGSVVLISSNSVPMKVDNKDLCAMLLNGEYDKACKYAKGHDGTANYSGTKKALVFWMRRNCAEWYKQGVRVNAIAPGMTMTPLVQAQFDDVKFKKLMEQFREKIPMGSAQPIDIAKIVLFLLSDESNYCCGSLLFADGGIDAITRPNEF